MGAETAAPKLDLGTKATKDDFEAVLKGILKGTWTAASLRKVCWQITSQPSSSSMQPLQYMPSCSTKEHWCSHYSGSAESELQNMKELRPMATEIAAARRSQRQSEKGWKRTTLKRKMIAPKLGKVCGNITVATLMQSQRYDLWCPVAKDHNNARAQNRDPPQHESAATFTQPLEWKNTMLRPPPSSPTEVPYNIHAAITIQSALQVANPHVSTHICSVMYVLLWYVLLCLYCYVYNCYVRIVTYCCAYINCYVSVYVLYCIVMYVLLCMYCYVSVYVLLCIIHCYACIDVMCMYCCVCMVMYVLLLS